ncbi:MAG: acetylglutamate kinase [Clostridia bacterium]|nr:acetylglutamate kinase [Clostridia bacterium]
MVLTALEKAGILVEALPYIRKFHGKTIVIKYGGHAMLNEELKKAVMQDIILMKLVGMHPVLVHGGGPEINEMLGRLGIKSDFVQGMRVTDRETMEIVEMVLVGKVNKEIVALINSYGGQAVGLSGEDGKLVEAGKKIIRTKNGEGELVEVDLGYVGEVRKINPEIIQTVIAQGYIPVIAPTGSGENGETYNINADYVAGEIAAALQADKLILLTDVEGIFANYEDKETLISSLRIDEVAQLIDRGVIAGGMIPKVECCVKALLGGVTKTHIIDGRLPHSILLEVFTDEGIGTEVVK